jgi:hypothetical protein
MKSLAKASSFTFAMPSEVTTVRASGDRVQSASSRMDASVEI